MTVILCLVLAYLLGSVPFGLIFAKAHKIDLRSIGSGNIGATNVSRALGKKWGYICFIMDTLKGLIAMLLTLWLLNPDTSTSGTHTIGFLWIWLITGCCAILGHVFPIYIGFKGGKGVATSFGVALGLWPYFTLCVLFALVIWIAIVLYWHYVSLASIVASVVFPLILVTAISLIPDWKFAALWPLVCISWIFPLIVILRHKDNIKRLKQGTENKIGRTKS